MSSNIIEHPVHSAALIQSVHASCGLPVRQSNVELPGLVIWHGTCNASPSPAEQLVLITNKSNKLWSAFISNVASKLRVSFGPGVDLELISGQHRLVTWREPSGCGGGGADLVKHEWQMLVAPNGKALSHQATQYISSYFKESILEIDSHTYLSAMAKTLSDTSSWM